ncbi:HAD-like protein [Pterulicium gracile]|uniref:HAD-like protein n=1 Tax=Pterulicium gracile TaxID=1884261 RepID=A0A5C3QY73_9AGAR|nr:HAD-like protein [Pterula gracilis]
MTTITVDAILFDMDGTLIDSTPGVLQAWAIFSKDYNLGDPAEIAHSAHGRRLYDTLKELCKLDDEVKLQAEIVRFEEAVINGGPFALPGALDLIQQLITGAPIGKFGWTIVTSATNVYTPSALAKCLVPLPSAGYITSNDVSNGKPHPDPYLAGAKKCGVDATNCLVIEDAIAGLKAGKNAGSKTLAVCTSTPREVISASDANPDFIVEDLTRVSAKWVGQKIELTIAA